MTDPDMKYSVQPDQALKVLLIVLSTCLASTSTRANVYATNIKLNGGLTNSVSATGTNVAVSYILNEPASSVELDILSGANVVRRLNLTDFGSTSRGSNLAFWDELDNNSNPVPAGTYQVSITAFSTGYTNWTHISSDDDVGAYVYFGEGIAVDRNATSPYYGRVFIANAQASGSQSALPGDLLGIMKMNADASAADEGGSSSDQDGYAWSDNGISPWRITVSDDEFVYVNDLGTGGQILRWDPLVSSNSLTYVLRRDNLPAQSQLGGPAILGTGTNTQIWMANNSNTVGILSWRLSTNGTCTSNDLGTLIVGAGTNFTTGPTEVAVDKSGNLYVCQSVITSLDPALRVFRFPAYDPSTNGGQPELVATWAVGAGLDDYAGANGIAVDPTGTYVAVAFGGTFDGATTANGNTKVLYTTNGSLVANIDLGVAFSGDVNHSDNACAWDAVGNLYYVDYYDGRWRAVSPPGTNQSTTIAIPTVQITGGGTSGPPPTIISINASGTSVTIDFTALSTDTAASFLVVGAATILGPFTQVPGATITQLSPGVFQATLTNNGGMQYFRIQRVGSAPPPPGNSPVITNLALNGANVVISFTGQTTDTASLFKLLNSPSAVGPYATNSTAVITQSSPGVFQASVAANGPIQFYRLQR